MKKAICFVLLGLLILSCISIAEPGQSCEKDEDCTNPDTGEECKDEECFKKHGTDSAECRKKTVSGGGAFHIREGMELFGMESEYDGRGFGIILPRRLFRPLNLYLYYNIRNFRIVPSEPLSATELSAVHFKEIKKPKSYTTVKGFHTWELLSNFDNNKVDYFEVVVRTERDLTAGKEVLILQNKNGIKRLTDFKRVKTYLKGTYLKVNLGNELGLLTLGEDSTPVQEESDSEETNSA